MSSWKPSKLSGGLMIELTLDESVALIFGDIRAEVVYANIKGERIKICIKAPREVFVERSSYRSRENRPKDLPRLGE